MVEGIRAKGGRAIGVTADVCSSEDTKRVFETALKAFGDVDILINNAGIGEQKIIDETDDDWMLYVMNTNLGGPMRYIREALKIFLCFRLHPVRPLQQPLSLPCGSDGPHEGDQPAFRFVKKKSTAYFKIRRAERVEKVA